MLKYYANSEPLPLYLEMVVERINAKLILFYVLQPKKG